LRIFYFLEKNKKKIISNREVKLVRVDGTVSFFRTRWQSR
jgi:hypothetical protein